MTTQPAIELKVSLTEKDLEDFYAHLAKNSVGMKMVIAFALFVFIAQSIRIVIDPQKLESGVIWIAFVLFLFVMMLYSNKYNARRAYKNNKRLQAQYTYLIKDNEIEICSNKKSTKLNWNNIQKITQSKNSLFLWLNKKQAQIIPKRTLTADQLETILLLKKLNR